MKAHYYLQVILTLLLASMWCLPTLTLAQESSDNMQILREKILADRKLIVAESLELSEAQAKDFWPVYEEYIVELQKHGAKGAFIIDDFARNYKDMTNDKAKHLLNEYMAYEADYLALRQNYLERFREALPEKKVARFYQIENKIRAIVNYELAGQIPLMK